jgi:hypothetical protein
LFKRSILSCAKRNAVSYDLLLARPTKTLSEACTIKLLTPD